MVLDTNVVLDLWAFADPRVGALRQALEAGQLDWLACPPMRSELQAVLARGVAAGHGAQPEAVLGRWDLHARCVEGWADGAAPRDHLALRCRDPDDQVFLDLALRSGAGWLLSSDRDLLSLRRAAARRGLRIARPALWTLEPPPGGLGTVEQLPLQG